MVPEELILNDDFEDDVYSLLQELNSITSWNKQAHGLKQTLRLLLESKGYICIATSNPTRYHVTSIGSSYLYDVPMDKHGHLASFRGLRVRIVCIGSGRHTWREIMVGKVCETPPEKIVIKRERTYTFPHYVSAFHCRYQSPRYRIIDIPPDSKMTFLSRKNEVIDLSGYSSLLIDGTVNAPIAAIRFNDDHTVGLKIAGYMGGRDHMSLREAIDWAASSVHQRI